MKAVLFDYFFTLAEPRLGDFTSLADTFGCAAEDLASLRRELLPMHPMTTSGFDGDPEPFRSFHDYWLEFGEALSSRLGVEGGGEAFAEDRRRAHRSATRYPDTAESIAWVREQGWRVGVLSDADTTFLNESIAANGLTFDVVLSSEQLSCYKPHCSCFHRACASLGVEPADVVYVGDSPVNDVEGSRRAGLQAVWLNRRGLMWPDDLDPPQRQISNLADLPVVLESLS